MQKIQNFKDLITWQEGHKLVLMIYKISKTFPKEEIFGLTSQMRRAAVSITSNIAEGFSRTHQTEKIQFYVIANSSLTELQNQLIITLDIAYIYEQEFSKIFEQTTTVQKLINGLVKSLRGRN